MYSPYPPYDVAIYALCDPDGEPRYVGMTYGPIRRLRQHLQQARRLQRHGVRLAAMSAKDAWLVQLLMRDQVPLLKILEMTRCARSQCLERRWIAWLRAEGHSLTNGPA